MLDKLVPIRILIIAPSAALSGYCAIIFKAGLNCEVYECHTKEVLSRQLVLTLAHDLLVFVRCPELHSFYLSKHPEHKALFVLSIEENQRFQQTIETFISENKHKFLDKEYVSINYKLILYHRQTPVDLYICLSNKTITPFLPATCTVLQKDINHLIELNLDDFYILSKDVKTFQEYSKKKIETNLLEISLQSDHVLDIFSKFKKLLGPQFKNLKKELVEEYDNYFINALKLCYTNPLLKKNIQENLANNIYFPVHMYMVGFIASRLAYLSGLEQTTTNTLFAFASIIHDLALTNDGENEIDLIKKLELGEFDTSPVKSSNLIHHGETVLNWTFSMESLPDWIGDILLKHHERPKGSGFPAGEDPQNFSLHTSIFIIAHMIFEDIYSAKDPNDTLPDILESFSTTHFPRGKIQKVAQTVKELKLTDD
jgi:response regulator RpfG family c-di-GMP phosphodiesterase